MSIVTSAAPAIAADQARAAQQDEQRQAGDGGGDRRRDRGEPVLRVEREGEEEREPQHDHEGLAVDVAELVDDDVLGVLVIGGVGGSDQGQSSEAQQHDRARDGGGAGDAERDRQGADHLGAVVERPREAQGDDRRDDEGRERAGTARQHRAHREGDVEGRQAAEHRELGTAEPVRALGRPQAVRHDDADHDRDGRQQQAVAQGRGHRREGRAREGEQRRLLPPVQQHPDTPDGADGEQRPEDEQGSAEPQPGTRGRAGQHREADQDGRAPRPAGGVRPGRHAVSSSVNRSRGSPSGDQAAMPRVPSTGVSVTK